MYVAPNPVLLVHRQIFLQVLIGSAECERNVVSANILAGVILVGPFAHYVVPGFLRVGKNVGNQFLEEVYKFIVVNDFQPA
jgi:hypothetical protein